MTTRHPLQAALMARPRRRLTAAPGTAPGASLSSEDGTRTGRLAECPPQEEDGEEDDCRGADEHEWPRTQHGSRNSAEDAADRPAERVEQAPDRRADPS